jgi:hypothetical protein
MRVTVKVNKETFLLAKAIAKKKGVSLSFLIESHLRELLKIPPMRIKKRKKVIN